MGKSKSNGKNTTVEALKGALEGTYSVTLGLTDQESVDKLEWLADDGRDFLKVSPAMVQAAHQAVAEAITAADLSNPALAVQQATEALGEAVLEVVALRFRGKRDYFMKPLSPGWVKQKGHARIGVWTGELFKDVVNARVIVKKK